MPERTWDQIKDAPPWAIMAALDCMDIQQRHIHDYQKTNPEPTKEEGIRATWDVHRKCVSVILNHFEQSKNKTE